ncbi:1-aminocyclopropane-1-carboxylate deaminase/D-cysteine desulfhydrase [Tenacibaculum agarivorans]|uniref:1-aminocyclopropane-1-carboxylate deaminase/D-cysteine desulfhydrase n=1 Tax=Tenacibaculum agarivorans TaxID=1908389 RepID=UPI00094B81E2|nr:pyridoxal-phosphate dependent enzyme [Tenacibaculum agarivorans]
MFSKNIKSENQQVNLSFLKEYEIELWIKREDLIHTYVSGNKFRKLKYNILEAKHQQKDTLLTFGGAFSNHIVATAVAGNLNGLKTIGIIRGEELGINFSKVIAENSTLRVAHNNGMKFEFIQRDVYRKKSTPSFIKSIKEKLGEFYLIPEGGTNKLAIKGCEEVLTNEDEKFNYICSAIGTGGTIAGLINSTKSHQQVIGFPALKGDFLYDEIKQLVTKTNWSLETEYHFGGYGKFTKELIEFINQFKSDTGILLDPIYTGKMIYGIVDKIKKKQFEKGSKILAIHTGGIQGIDGFNRRLAKKNMDLIQV